MAEPLSPQDLALFKAHLSKFPVHDACPICHTRGWTIVGLEFGFGSAGGEPSLYMPMIPYVTIVCKTCFFARHFAWTPIVMSAADG